VRNSKSLSIASEENKEQPASETPSVVIEAPRLKIDFQGFRASEKPCVMELYLHKTHLHIDRDQITGYLHMKELAREIQSRIKNVKI
jgi:hypothetical protein